MGMEGMSKEEYKNSYGNTCSFNIWNVSLVILLGKCSIILILLGGISGQTYSDAQRLFLAFHSGTTPATWGVGI